MHDKQFQCSVHSLALSLFALNQFLRDFFDYIIGVQLLSDVSRTAIELADFCCQG